MGRGGYGLMAEKPQGCRPLRRPIHRWEDNIKMDLREIEKVKWSVLAPDRD
jgi:hypothetical protein